MSLQVLELYGHATLQGAPRFGLRQFGVPPGGAFDQESHDIANAIVGNAPDALTLELAMGSVRFKPSTDVRIAIVGATCMVSHHYRLPYGGHHNIKAGEEVKIEPPTKHCRVYLAVAGGFQKRTAQIIKTGNALETRPSEITRLSGYHADYDQTSILPAPIGVIPFGSERLPVELQERDLNVSMRSDRVGIRIEGTNFDPGPEQLSEPACPGAIQVTNDGGLVIHGPDGPTIGGYRKIGVVCAADINLVAQLRPGGACRFTEISRVQALRYNEIQASKRNVMLNRIRKGFEETIADLRS